MLNLKKLIVFSVVMFAPFILYYFPVTWLLLLISLLFVIYKIISMKLKTKKYFKNDTNNKNIIKTKIVWILIPKIFVIGELNSDRKELIFLYKNNYYSELTDFLTEEEIDNYKLSIVGQSTKNDLRRARNESSKYNAILIVLLTFSLFVALNADNLNPSTLTTIFVAIFAGFIFIQVKIQKIKKRNNL